VGVRVYLVCVDGGSTVKGWGIGWVIEGEFGACAFGSCSPWGGVGGGKDNGDNRLAEVWRVLGSRDVHLF